MPKGTLGALTLALLGTAVLVAYFVFTRPAPAPVVEVATPETGSAGETVDGPTLEIEISGVANGKVTIQLLPEIAPGHVERVVTLAKEGAYDGIAFHRVIDGFMAQTGDVEHGRVGGSLALAGTGGSDLPDLPAEFSDVAYERGVVGMARSSNPNSANSQFFIMFAAAPNLNGNYTVFGRVVDGMDVVDAIKRGEGGNGAVLGVPDMMMTVTASD